MITRFLSMMQKHGITLVFQTSNGNHTNAVVPAIRVIPDSRQNHKERRGLHFFRVDFLLHRFQAFCPFFDKLIAAEFHFNQAVFPVSQVNDSITFLPVLVAVVIHLPVQSIRKYT